MKSLADDKKKITSIKRRSLPVCHCRAPSQNEIAKLFFSGHKREPKHHDTLFLSPWRHFQSTRFVVSERFRKLSNNCLIGRLLCKIIAHGAYDYLKTQGTKRVWKVFTQRRTRGTHRFRRWPHIFNNNDFFFFLKGRISTRLQSLI